MILFFSSQSHGGSLRVKPFGFYFMCLCASMFFFVFLFCSFYFSVFSIELKLSCWIAWGSCLHGVLVEFLMSIAVVWEDRGG